MQQQKRIVGGNKPPETKQRPTPWFLLRGDVSELLVPLCDPVRKTLEQFAALNPAAKIVPLWQVALAQSTDPDDIGYEPYPDDDDQLADIYQKPGGGPLDAYPWADGRFARPESWDALFEVWYRTQRFFGMRELVDAFGDAMEAVTGIPLGQFAPLLALWLLSGPGGVDGSSSKPASTSTTTPTGPKSGRRSTTSKPSAPTPKPAAAGSTT